MTTDLDYNSSQAKSKLTSQSKYENKRNAATTCKQPQFYVLGSFLAQ
jgi:hypothetical protein